MKLLTFFLEGGFRLIYDLPSIEKKQIELAQEQHLYRIERDRLKPRFFLYTSYPTINYYGLDLTETKKFICADVMARFQRYLGKNVLFSVGYDNLSNEIYNVAAKLGKTAHSFNIAGFLPYQKQLRLLDISFDSSGELCLNSEEYTYFVQKFFYHLLDQELIKQEVGYLVYDDKKVYQPYEYQQDGDEFFDLYSRPLQASKRPIFTLEISSIKKDVYKIIDHLPLQEKSELLAKLGYYEGLRIVLNTTNDNQITLDLGDPELFFGISYLVINPQLLDVNPYLDGVEIASSSVIGEELIYSGVDAINYVNNYQIPIFVSKRFKDAIHLGIPSFSEEDEFLANHYDLPFLPIFDFIDGQKVLVNSHFLNGYSLGEARKLIIEQMVSVGIGESYSDFKTNRLVISSPFRFGIPIPLYNDLKKTNIPLIYNLKHEVRMYQGEIADKNLVKDFFNSDFAKGMIINALRLKEETGIMDFETKEALEQVTRFPNIDCSFYKQENYANELAWQIVFAALFKKYYVESFAYEYKKIVLIENVLDENAQTICRDNNNLISLDELLTKYGSTVVRVAFVNNLKENNLFSLSQLDESGRLIERVIKAFYYPIDDNCYDLESAYQCLLYSSKEWLSRGEVQKFFALLLEFVEKVHLVKHISHNQSKGLLIMMSVIMPSLAEQIKKDVLNLKEPLVFYSWPE